MLRHGRGFVRNGADCYKYQTLVNSVSLQSHRLLSETGKAMVENGREKKSSAPLREHCDSLTAQTNVHYPTDVSLL